MASIVRWGLGFAGRKAARAAAKARPGRRPLLDLPEGLRLFRDRTVPGGLKLLALVLGTAAVGLFVTMELPVEAVVGAVLNVFGFGLDFLVDGLEMVVGPLVFAALLLPHLVGRQYPWPSTETATLPRNDLNRYVK